jgi:hypothetical protein
LPAKNTLTAADAKIVEEQARLFTIGDARTADGTSDASTQLGLAWLDFEFGFVLPKQSKCINQ